MESLCCVPHDEESSLPELYSKNICKILYGFTGNLHLSKFTLLGNRVPVQALMPHGRSILFER